LAVFLSVLSSLMVGVVLLVAPWTTPMTPVTGSLWDVNYLLQYPAVRAVLLNPFMRGTVSGLGLVNIVLAVHEARQHLARER
jgi:hypothetical protein